jgi:hypothetical protein
MGPGAEPAVHCGPRAVGHQIQQPTALQVDQAGYPAGGRDPSGLEEAGLLQPERGHAVQAGGSSTRGCRARAPPASRSASQPPGSRATAATAWASLPTRRQASALARSVSTARGRIAGVRSVQVRTLQAGSRQRHRRLRQASTTGGHRLAGRAPAIRGGRAGWPVHRSPHSRSPWPWSGRPAATRHPPAQPRRPLSRPGPAASTQTHYCVGPPGVSLLLDVRHPQDMRGPRCPLEPYGAVSGTHHASWRRAL